MLETIMKRQLVKTESAVVSEELIESVWQKGKIINGHSPTKYRQDVCGAWIMREKHGQTDSSYGWEIDSFETISDDGETEDNLRPLQWENKKGKKDGEVICIVKATGPNNA